MNKRGLLSDLYSLLETKKDVEELAPWSDRGQRWLARGTSLLKQVDAGLATQFGNLQLRLRIMAGPVWNGMLVIIRKAISDLEVELSAVSGDLDSFTGLVRKEARDTEMELILNEHQMSQLPLALAIIDIDRFKTVNDEYGHQIGDVVLRGIAGRVREAVEGRGQAYRYAGDEIVVVFPNMTPGETIPVAARIRSNIEAVRFEPLAWPITVSIGIAAFPQHGQDLQGLFRAADRAVLSAKNSGGNRVQVAGE